MISIANRSYQTEIIDGENYSPSEYELMLSQLETINHLSRGYAPTLQAVAKVARAHPGKTLRILDVGSGHGDTLREIRKWADRKGVSVQLVGIDLNPKAAACATARTPSSMKISFRTGDVFQYDATDFDLIINSLMTHHLNDDQIVQLVSWMTKNAKLGWFINDLHRHPVAYYFIKYATRLIGFNRLIQNDAPLSVARGFSRADWYNYLQRAGVPVSCVSIAWHFPFRYGVTFHAVQA